MAYLHARREKLGGYLPQRSTAAEALKTPSATAFAKFALEAAGKEMSSTVAFVRMAGALRKDGVVGRRIVPIIADEARTFGMADLFRQIGIYSPIGQLYEPEDQHQLSYYKEAVDGQILEEGISEAGAMASWVAAATSYSAHGLAMLPMYIYSRCSLPARGRRDLGRGRLALARLPPRRDRGPHHAFRGRPAAPGRHQPAHRFHGAELPRLRPVLRLRARGDPRGGHAAHAGRAGGRLLLRDPHERELRDAVDARGRARGDIARDACCPVGGRRWRVRLSVRARS
jgi:hypothetical protein